MQIHLPVGKCYIGTWKPARERAQRLVACPGQSSHRLTLPDPLLCLQIRGTDKSSVRELHIAYRYGEHYDSVRRINDNSEAPAHLQTDVSETLVPSVLRPVGSRSRAVSWSQAPGTSCCCRLLKSCCQRTVAPNVKIFQPAKALTALAWQLGFDPRNPHGGRKEPALTRCPQTHTWGRGTCAHTHKCKKLMYFVFLTF